MSVCDADVDPKKIPRRTVSNAGAPEKIILCVDCCDSAVPPRFESVATLKRLISLFLYSKRAIDRETRFALVLVKKAGPVWAHPFTENPIDIIVALDACDLEASDESEFDLSPLLDLILPNVDLPDIREDYKLAPPPYTVRLLLLYNRSGRPTDLISDRRYYDVLVKHPYFALDILYSHDENFDEAERSEIFNRLQSFDNGYSYIFAAPRDAKKMYECGAKLLAHPLQRPLQKDTCYSFPR